MMIYMRTVKTGPECRHLGVKPTCSPSSASSSGCRSTRCTSSRCAGKGRSAAWAQRSGRWRTATSAQRWNRCRRSARWSLSAPGTAWGGTQTNRLFNCDTLGPNIRTKTAVTVVKLLLTEQSWWPKGDRGCRRSPDAEQWWPASL